MLSCFYWSSCDQSKNKQPKNTLIYKQTSGCEIGSMWYPWGYRSAERSTNTTGNLRVSSRGDLLHGLIKKSKSHKSVISVCTIFSLAHSNLFESNKKNTLKKYPSKKCHKHKIKTDEKVWNLGSIYDRQGTNFLNVWGLFQINNKKKKTITQ